MRLCPIPARRVILAKVVVTSKAAFPASIAARCFRRSRPIACAQSRRAEMNVAEYILARLAEAGLTHMFAVPGDYASPFLEALDTMKEIVRVPNINELGSGYAADGYARFKGI